jgi:hypothetical protein
MILTTIAFFYGGVVEKKKVTAVIAITFFYGAVAKKKKKTTVAYVTFFDGFVAKKSDDNYCCLFGGFVA